MTVLGIGISYGVATLVAMFAGMPIAFGHWSTLGLVDTPLLLGIDTGCVWGGALTAVRVDGGRREVVQVKCPQARKPG